MWNPRRPRRLPVGSAAVTATRAIAVTTMVASPAVGPARAAAAPAVTIRVAPPGVDPNGASGDPSFGGASGYLAFASQATNLGPAVGQAGISNIYTFDVVGHTVGLVSAGLGRPANGPSVTPSMSASGQVVAFASRATNLVPNTHKHISDVFVRFGTGPIHLLSAGFGGVQPDASSSQPVISANGRYVAFRSSADDLVPGDDNDASDIFVVDLLTRAVTRADVSSRGRQAKGDAYNPSISADGSLISFTSDASNLVRGDRNRVADVFVHDMRTGVTRRVSVSSRGHEQNASVPAPFQQISDLSADGGSIVFDSNATNLVAGPRAHHTEVFRRDLVSGRTTIVSLGARGRPANNDSFAPSTSAHGGVTVFESFADNLVRPWVPNENVFVRDAARSSMSTVDVSPTGGPRGPEVDQQLLQQAAVSPDGLFVAFVSGADNLVAGDYNGLDDLFLRYLGGP